MTQIDKEVKNRHGAVTATRAGHNYNMGRPEALYGLWAALERGAADGL